MNRFPHLYFRIAKLKRHSQNGFVNKGILLGLVLLCVGCSKGPTYEGKQRFEVTGTVTLDGQPMDQGSIAFIGSRSAQGTVENGTYIIAEAFGPTEGTYQVRFSREAETGKMVPGVETDGETGDEVEIQVPELAESLPERYLKGEEHEVAIGPDKTVHNFELTSE